MNEALCKHYYMQEKFLVEENYYQSCQNIVHMFIHNVRQFQLKYFY